MENEKTVEQVATEIENNVEQTYEKYATDMNTHADQCETCTLARKMNSTQGVCDEGKKLVDTWKAFVAVEQEKFFSSIKRLTVNGRFDAETNDVKND
jgi:hypothetical protein